MAGFATVHLDELEAIPGPGTLTWHPVRAALDVRAFGCNAFSATRAGDDVVEPHDETTHEHEELYFVARGSARFTIDGESFDAPAGTYVKVEPQAHRHAVAVVVPATVLSFGGPRTFTPSAWEWTLRSAALADSDPQAARAVVDDGLRHHPESPGIRIARARLRLAEGDEQGARDDVRDALERQPEAIELVHTHPALAALIDVAG
jgi:cupin domain